MRAISLTNSWLSGVQKGLQTGHALVELGLLVRKYESELPQKFFTDWAENHKTLIVLEGGSHKDLWDFHDFLYANRHEFAGNLIFAHFEEDEESLNDAYTAVVLVLSDKYETWLGEWRDRVTASLIREFMSESEIKLFDWISRCKLAS
jgi:hypothetical protein